MGLFGKGGIKKTIKQGGTGALIGAGIGAGVGTLFGPGGTAVGAAVGGELGAAGGAWLGRQDKSVMGTLGISAKGKKQSVSNVPNMTPDQMNFLNNLSQYGSANLDTIMTGLGSGAGAYNPNQLQQTDQNAAGYIGQSTVSGLSNNGSDAYANIDMNNVARNTGFLSQAGMNQIDAQYAGQIANATGSAERFSTANSLIRGRLAGEAAIQKSSLLSNVFAQQMGQAQSGLESLYGRQQQGSQFDIGTNLQNQQFNIGNQMAIGQYNNQLGYQKAQLGVQGFNNQAGLLSSLLSAQPYNTVVDPGQASLIDRLLPTVATVGAAKILK